jgi:anti-anti-sigma factor
MRRLTADDEEVIVRAMAHRLTVVDLSRELDASLLLARTLLDQLELQPQLVVHFDATRVDFVDSSGLAALAIAATAVRQHGGFVSMRASASARRVIELCRMGPSLGLPALLPGVTPSRSGSARRPVTRGPVSRDRRYMD